MLKLLLAFALASCALPHVPPKPRNDFAEGYTRVRVQVTCGERSPFKRNKEDMPWSYEPHIQWIPDTDGTGVIISERHVLTAAHVVRCPIIPMVHVIMADGRRFKMMVERDDAQFGAGADLARLELVSAGGFGAGIPPPALDTETTPARVIWCATTLRGAACGHTIAIGIDTATFSGITRKGDSGAAVYDTTGLLVGLVVAGTGESTEVVRVTPQWLEGT